MDSVFMCLAVFKLLYHLTSRVCTSCLFYLWKLRSVRLSKYFAHVSIICAYRNMQYVDVGGVSIVGVAPIEHLIRETMGQSESSFKKNYEETVSELSSVQLREITTRFGEVYAKAGGSKGHLVDREAFSNYFKLPVAVGERLFEAFDVKKVMRTRHLTCVAVGEFCAVQCCGVGVVMQACSPAERPHQL